MNKRILSILLAVTMLFPGEGMGLAAGKIPYGQEGQATFALPGQDTQSPEDSGTLPGQEIQSPEESSAPSGQDTESSENPVNPPDPDTQSPEAPEAPPEQQEESVYTIRFNLAGGTATDGEEYISMQVKEGELPDAGAVAEVERKGYLFQGWLDWNGNYYKFDEPLTGDISLLASWTPITYRVRFDLNGGDGEEIQERSFTYDQEEPLPVKVGKKPGYVFWGWKQKGVDFYPAGSTVKNLAEQDGAVVTLKAVWKRGRYSVQFHANGGTGTMKGQSIVCGGTKNLHQNQFQNPGYTFAGWNTRKDGSGDSYADKDEVNFPDMEGGSTVVLYAMWKGNPYQVVYHGNGASSGSVKASRHIYGTPGKLSPNCFKRKGYVFAGWNTQKDGKGKTYKDGALVSKLTQKLNGTVTLYAKWRTQPYCITYEARGGKLEKSARKTYNIQTNTFMLPTPKRRGYDFDGWYRDSSLKKRVSKIAKGSTGDKKFYAKWVRCTNRIRKDSARLTACRATGVGKVRISASIRRRVASDDDRYYLVYVNPMNGEPYRMVRETYKKTRLVFQLKTSQNQGYAVSMFGIAVKKQGRFRLISRASYVGNAEKAARNKSKYKLGKTKKGIQFYNNMKEIDDCGAKNNFLNITVSMVCTDATVPYEYNGKMYYFNRMDEYRQIVSECNRKGINVSAQIMLTWLDGWTDLIHPKARVKDAAPFYTWNVYHNAAREKMEAIFCYLGEVFGAKNCYISNWILGNEINNPKNWNYLGTMSEKTYFRTYAQAFRTLYYAVRSQYSNARVYLCTDNMWNTVVDGGYTVKHTITSFVKHLNQVQKGIKWNLAYHAYSSPLSYTNFWEGFGITNDLKTPCITMKNLHLLTRWMKKRYGSSVRIILSEQGYTSTWGQANQAAALAGSYYIAACNPMVDSFIIRSYHDHPVEVAMGLSMGIKGKEAYSVFKYMDTSKSLRYTKRYLKLMGLKSWKQLVPGYNKRWLTRMYRR